MTQSTITCYFKKEIQSVTQSTNTHYIKEEIDIDWDETDNCYGEAYDDEQRERTAKEVLEKFPEPSLQDNVDTKNATSIKTEPESSKKCPKCDQKFNQIKYLRTHRLYCKMDHDNLQCAHCSFKTKYKSALIGHLTKAHGSGKNIHQPEHDNARKYCRICENCNKISKALNPTKCERCFNDKLLYQCSICANLFKTRSLASYHWSTRCGVKGYFKCTKCDFKSVWRSKIVQHMEIMHKSPHLSQELENIEWIGLSHDDVIAVSNTYNCPKCSKKMGNSVKLSRHIQLCGGLGFAKNDEMLSKKSREVHVDPKLTLSKCSSCGKRFSHIYSLNDHIRYCKMKMEYMTKVTNDKDVEDVETDCPSESLMSADKRYARYIKMMVRYCSKCQEDTALEEINRGLSRKVPCHKCKTTLLFKCTKCLKQSTEYKVIKNHLDTICNPKEEFKCTKCTYKSYSPRLVQTHYHTMHGDANFECKQCGNKFRRNYHLRTHLRRCGVEPIFQCEHCSFQSKRKLYLKRHIFRSHMGPVVNDGRNAIKKTKQDFSRAMIHLKAHCLKCKNEQRVSNRLKTCKKCKAKLCFQCKTCQKNYNVDDKNACNHVKVYLEAIKFDCKRCGRGFKLIKYVQAHEIHCLAKVTFKCRFCKYAAKIKASVIMHEKVIHLNEA